MDNQFCAGFSRVNVTPPLGIAISGYFVDRFASGVLDELEANALAVSFANQRAVLIALDNLMIDQAQMRAYRKAIAETTGLPVAAVMIACTHTHTGPLVGRYPLDESRAGEAQYTEYLGRKLIDGARLALADCAPAQMGYAVGQAQNISFIRRFRMRDGSIRTNPGVNNPDIAAPIGEADTRVNVLRFVREGAGDILVANFGVHPDTIGGDKISADYPRFVRETTERVLPGVSCLFFNGAEGDVGPRLSNGSTTGDISYIYETGGIAALDAVCAYRKIKNYLNTPLSVVTGNLSLPVKERIPLETAREKYKKYEGKRVNTEGLSAKYYSDVIASYEQNLPCPTSLDIPQTLIALGDIVFVPFPFEMFSEISLRLRDYSPYTHTLCLGITNGTYGYLPTKTQLCLGGYEVNYFQISRVWPLADNTDDNIIRENLRLMEELKCTE